MGQQELHKATYKTTWGDSFCYSSQVETQVDF